MRDVVSTPAEDVADADMAAVVASLLEKALARPVRIVSLHRRSSEFATLSPAEQLTVVLADGHHISMFVKHIGNEQSHHPDKQQRNRETLVYEQLLQDRSLPAPKYYGTRRDAPKGRSEIYLEYVDDWNLKYHELAHWFTAARRLADVHAHFACKSREAPAFDFLLRLDEAYFRAWGTRALVTVGQTSPVLEERLKRLLDHYACATELLASQPTTLVHNDLSPKNVIAARNSTPAAIYIVDWEMAGVGCGLLDLVHLKYGLDIDTDRRMVAEYCASLRPTGLLPGDERELARLLAACELHKTFYRLAHSAMWQLPPERITRWVEEAEGFLRQAKGIAV
jgi:aminoglycoside phosphotransferase (APT) family kinase protein